MLGNQTRFVERLVLGMWQANCYLIGDRELGQAFVVDPGQDATAVLPERLEANAVTCEAILLTHGHLDHLWSAPELAERWDVPVRLHVEDRYLWDDPGAAFGNLPPNAMEAQFGLRWNPAADHLETVADGQRMTVAGLQVLVRHTPGHTPGSSVFLLDDVGTDDPVLVSGDLIFQGSVGRTDFPRGSWDQQMESLERVVLPLGDRTLIVSGHGDETTVGVERRTNPYLRELVTGS